LKSRDFDKKSKEVADIAKHLKLIKQGVLGRIRKGALISSMDDPAFRQRGKALGTPR
jgi:hypothetical protein